MRLLVTNQDKMVNEVEVETVKAEPGKEYVFTVENEINDVNLSQDGCVARENGLVMIDSGASVNVGPKWFGNFKLEQSYGVTCLKGANGKPLQEYGKRQILVENLRSDETVRFPCGKRDEADLECKLLV